MMGSTEERTATLEVIAVTSLMLVSVAAGAGFSSGLAPSSGGTAASSVGPASDGSAGTPRGIHLSVTGNASTTMTVTWFTDGAHDPGTVVEHGPSCDRLDRTVHGASSTLTLAPDVRVHNATMTGLAPGETFAYRVGGASGFSDCYRAHTVAPDEPVSFAVYGDQGTDGGAPYVHDVIEGDLDELDMVLIAGDLSYAEGHVPTWREWFDMNQDIFARIPLMAAPGNHETYASVGTVPFQERLTQPGAELYFSFDYANVHVLAFHSTLSNAREEGVLVDMLRFAQEDLQQAFEAKQAGQIDHIFVVQHHPLYSNAQKADRWIDADIVALQEQWFHRYDVKLVFTGHNHHYERSYPMAYQVPTTTEPTGYEDPAGWIEVITGGAGQGKYELRHPDDRLPYSAVGRELHHYTRVSVDGETVRVQAIRARLDPGRVFDDFNLTDTDALVPASVATLDEPVGGGSGPSWLLPAEG